MKFAFTTLDVICAVEEAREKVIGCRVKNVYDVNTKTYLLKLTKGDERFVLLIESGTRIHLTDFEWAKGMMPSGFSMKLRKHIKNRKLSDIRQIGMDRVVDIQFGYDENSFHLIVELYDRGNMCFTDQSYTILHLLRPRTDANHDVRYATHEKYPLELLRPVPECVQLNSLEAIRARVFELIADTFQSWGAPEQKPKSLPVSKVLSTEFGYGGPLIEHCHQLASKSLPLSITTELTQEDKDAYRLAYAERFAEIMLVIVRRARHLDDSGDSEAADPMRGYIFGKKTQPDDTELVSQDEFLPFLFEQFRNKPHVGFPTFNQAVDVYFSKIESQRTNDRLIQAEKKASKKLENIKRDHENRLSALKADQDADMRKAALIESNQHLVDRIILMLNHALSNQLDWTQMASLVEEAKQRGDPVASHIVQLNLQFNQVTVHLSDPFDRWSDEDHSRTSTPRSTDKESGMEVVLDLDMNALCNARKYYDKRRAALKKEEKTLIASNKAMKSAAFKARQTQKDFATVMQISRVRKPLWFEKFFWFISSENYLVVAGRDAPQNEALVKRYLGPDDIYVHADVHGASSVIVKARPWTADEGSPAADLDGDRSRPSSLPVPPLKTLTEAGTMAVAFSSAWTARVVTNAYWVRRDQVSKTAPSGEYLTTGAFMIRGRKNYLPPCQLVYGFGILFKLDADSLPNHVNERRVASTDSGLRDVASAALVPEDSTRAPSTHVQPEVTESTNVVDSAFPETELRLDLGKQNKRFSHPTDANEAGNRSFREASSRQSKPTSKQKQPTAPKPKSSVISEQPAAPAQPPVATQPLKRGQKWKLKKIREKYSEQDEDERMLRMQLLQGKSAKLSKQHARLAAPAPVNQEPHVDLSPEEEPEPDLPVQSNEDETAAPEDCEPDLPDKPSVDILQDEEEEDEPVEQPNLDEWLNLLDSFTGQPVDGDVLLYALPVCAPYPALANYKFKMKLIPGTMKRGSASKLILQQFCGDKTARPREKELIRVLRTEDTSRNFPGSVKVSVPQGKGGAKK